MSNNLHDLTTAISQMVASNAQIDPTTGSVSNLSDLWKASFDVTGLLTAEDAQRYHNHRDHFVAGFNDGVGRAAYPIFQANPELASVTATAPMFDDTVALKINRQSTFPVPGKDETVTVYGASNLSVTVRSARNVGELRISRQSLKSLYSALAD
jgi:hypothetical protein